MDKKAAFVLKFVPKKWTKQIGEFERSMVDELMGRQVEGVTSG